MQIGPRKGGKDLKAIRPDLAPDGKRFAVVLDPSGVAEQKVKRTDSVIVMLNFLDELRRKVPTGKN